MVALNPRSGFTAITNALIANARAMEIVVRARLLPDMEYHAYCYKVPDGYALLITVHPFPSSYDADSWLNDIVLLLTGDDEEQTLH